MLIGTYLIVIILQDIIVPLTMTNLIPDHAFDVNVQVLFKF